MEYNLSASVTISIYTTVEANSKIEAIEIAEDRDIVQYEFGREDEKNDNWIAEEYDGLPQDISVNKE